MIDLLIILGFGFVVVFLNARMKAIEASHNWLKQDVQLLDKQMFRVRFIDPLNRVERDLDRFENGCCGKCKGRG